MSRIYGIIKQLENTGSTKEKQDILADHKEDVLLKEVFRLTYSPTINFYMKRDLHPTYSGQCLLDLEEILLALEKVSSRKLTGNAAIEYVESLLGNTSDYNSYIIQCILKGDLRCGVGTTLVNKIWKGLIVKPPRLGAKAMNDKSLASLKGKTLAVELKSDGSYMAFNKTLMSRSGNAIVVEPLELHLNCGAFEGFALEGEGIFDETKADRSTGNGIVGKIVKGTASDEEKEGIIYQVWDCVEAEYYEPKGVYTLSNKDRRELLEIMFREYHRWCTTNNTSPKLQLIPRKEDVTLEEAMEVFKGYVEAGFEGAILKDMDAYWTDNGKPACCIKLKRKDPADLVCVGIYEGTGKAAGMLGGLSLESIEGRIKVNCGSGFSDEQRQQFFNNTNLVVGKVVEVEYDSVTKDKKTGTESLFLPIFKQIRDDKLEPDSYQEILDKVRIKTK